MNNNIPINHDDLCHDVQSLVEDQSPLLCVYYDQESQKVKVLGDSETLRKLGTSEVLTELEIIVRNTHEEKKKLKYSEQESAAAKFCTSSNHCCLDPEPKEQMRWGSKVVCHLEDEKLEPKVDWQDRLPSEILQQIFDYLALKDLKNMLLVSQAWKRAAEKPSLWTCFHLPEKCYKNEDNFVKFFEGSLSLNLQHLTLNQQFEFQLNDDNFKKLLGLKLSSLKLMAVPGLDLSNVSGEKLSQLVKNCKKCEIFGSHLESEKLKVVLTAMKTSTTLKSIDLSFVNLDAMPINILTDAFNKLDTLRLYEVELSLTKFKSLLESLTRRTEVTIEHMFEADGDVLDSVLDKLVGLKYNSEDNNEDGQLNEWMEIFDKSCKLKFLGLSSISAHGVPPKLLARVLTKIERLELYEMELSSEQAQEIFLAMSKSDSRVRHLSMGQVVISTVDCEVFAKAVNKLESVSIFDHSGDLSEDQLIEMFRVMSLGTNLKLLGSREGGECSLTRVDLIKNIGKVNPLILAKALNNLEEIDIYFGGSGLPLKCYLTLTQIIAFFKEFNTKTSLKTIFRGGWEFFDV